MIKVTVIGSGLIGSSWAIAFAKAGHEVHVYDRDEASFEKSKNYIKEELAAITDANGSGDLADTMRLISYRDFFRARPSGRKRRDSGKLVLECCLF